MGVTLVLLDHPCYGIDVWEAETDEDIEVGRRQGYIPLTELRQMPKRIDELEAQRVAVDMAMRIKKISKGE